MSQWLYAGLEEAGFAVELLETRHVRDAFKAMAVKTDRKDARGIAQLLRLGWFKPVHCKSAAAQEVRALLTARKLVQSKLYDVEMSLRGILRRFGLKIGPATPNRFAGRVGELTQDHPALKAIAKALIAVHEVLLRELCVFEKQVRMLARSDQRVRLLMTSARRWRDRCVDLCLGGRRSGPVFIVQTGRRSFRSHAKEVSIRGDRYHGAHLKDRR